MNRRSKKKNPFVDYGGTNDQANTPIEQSDSYSYIEKAGLDHFYYNILINNKTSEAVRATFSETRSTTILDDPSLYNASVIRFYISANSSIPIFYFQPQPQFVNNVLTNTNPNLGVYSVTLSFGGIDLQSFVIYNSFESTTQIANPPSDWTTVNENNIGYYSVFRYENFIKMINNALAESYFYIDKTSPPKVAGAPAPFLSFDPVSHIISLVVHKSFQSTASVPSVQIYFNEALFEFFQNFSSIFNGFNNIDGKDRLIIIDNLGTNSATIPQPHPFSYFPLWFNYVTYAVDDLVSFNGISYRSLTPANLGNQPDIHPANWFPEDIAWNIATTYKINDIVVYNNVRYISKSNANIGNQPDISPANWQMNAPFEVSSWDPTVTYGINQVILYLGTYYISIAGANLGNIPSSSITKWKIYTGFDDFVISQEYESLYNWNSITNLLFTSASLPITQEFTPAQNNMINTTTSTTNSTLAILTDFAVASTTGFDIKEPIIFNSQGEYRLINMSSQSPLRAMDISAYWSDRFNNIFPIFLEPTGQLTIKILFRRKTAKGGLSY